MDSLYKYLLHGETLKSFYGFEPQVDPSYVHLIDTLCEGKKGDVCFLMSLRGQRVDLD